MQEPQESWRLPNKSDVESLEHWRAEVLRLALVGISVVEEGLEGYALQNDEFAPLNGLTSTSELVEMSKELRRKTQAWRNRIKVPSGSSQNWRTELQAAQRNFEAAKMALALPQGISNDGITAALAPPPASSASRESEDYHSADEASETIPADPPASGDSRSQDLTAGGDLRSQVATNNSDDDASSDITQDPSFAASLDAGSRRYQDAFKTLLGKFAGTLTLKKLRKVKGGMSGRQLRQMGLRVAVVYLVQASLYHLEWERVSV